jgi:hypothetical protein
MHAEFARLEVPLACGLGVKRLQRLHVDVCPSACWAPSVLQYGQCPRLLMTRVSYLKLKGKADVCTGVRPSTSGGFAVFLLVGYKGGKMYWLAIHSNQANLIVGGLRHRHHQQTR